MDIKNQELRNSSEILSNSSSSINSIGSENSLCSKISSYGSYNDFKQIDINSTNKIQKLDFKIACLFLILGIGEMFPFQSFMASIDYFNIIFSDYNITSTFSFIYMASMCCTFGMTLFFYKKLKQHIMLLVGLPLYVVIMILIPVINIIGDKSILIKYIFTLIIIGSCAIIDAVCQSCVFSLASLFGPQYTNFAQFGIGVSSIIVLLTRLICKLSFPSDLHGFKIGSIVFFSISVIVIVFSWLTFIYFLRLPVGQTLKNGNREIETKGYQEDDITTTTKKEEHPFKYVIKNNWEHNVILFYVFLITFLLFPGIMIQVKSSRISVDWYTFIIVAIINISDCIGKSIPLLTHSKYILPIKYVWSMLIGRTVFIALFFLALYTSFFNHEAWVLSFVFIFGISGGYIACYTISEGPKKLENYKSFTAILLQSSLNVGLLFGSTLNLMIVSVQ